MPSLELRFAEDRTWASLVADGEHTDALARLIARLPTARAMGPGFGRVQVDELLSNLNILQQWPTPDDVHWDLDLRRLVEDSHADARAARQILDGDAPVPRELPLELEAHWEEKLTEFQIIIYGG